jgi:trehalose 6-phosphate synthase/phosphatase
MYPLFERREALNFYFLGFLLALPGDVSPAEADGELDELLESARCFRVKVDAETATLATEFCSKYFWPLMNNMVPFAITGEDRFPQLWRSFKTMNERFAVASMDIANRTGQGDTCGEALFWFNDYHVVLSGEFVRVRQRSAKIGIFMHTAFPSSEVFMTLPVRSEIVRALLAGDVVGFQLFEYARHFLTVVRKVTGVRPVYRLGGLVSLETSENRTVSLRVAHNSVEAEMVQAAAVKNLRSAVRLKQELGEGRTVIGAVDRFSKFAGLDLKLKAFRQFLANYPQYREKVVLVQAVVGKPSVEREELLSLVDAINGEFGPHVVWIEGSDRVEQDRLAVLCISDVLLDTSVRDGLNLVPLEYLVARAAYLEATGDSGGAAAGGRLVVSEYSGASRVLSRARRCNPWSQRDVVSALDEVLSWSVGEADRRFAKDASYVREYGQINWASEFAEDVLVTGGDGSAVVSADAEVGPPRLDARRVLRGYLECGRRRVFLLDYEGTLSGGDLTARGAGIGPEVVEILNRIAGDERNAVMILSGREPKLMEQWFCGASTGVHPRVYLAAEHGFYVRQVGQTSEEGSADWRCMVPEGSLRHMVKWKEIARILMDVTTRRVANSFVENKGSAIVWQWRGADPVFGLSQAKMLHAGLEEYLKGFNVEITTGKGYTEVRLRGVNKGAAVHQLLAEATDDGSDTVDFVLSAGDDLGDEFMFEAVNGRIEIPEKFTVKIGKNIRTTAQFFLPNPEALHETLALIAYNTY